jgi:hypothetical protein
MGPEHPHGLPQNRVPIIFFGARHKSIFKRVLKHSFYYLKRAGGLCLAAGVILGDCQRYPEYVRIKRTRFEFDSMDELNARIFAGTLCGPMAGRDWRGARGQGDD